MPTTEILNRSFSRTAIAIVTLACAGLSGCGPEQANSIQQTKPAPDEVIHFTLTDANNISIPAMLNETHAVDMMFHTAVSSVSVTGETIERTGLKLDQLADVKSWGGASSARFGNGHSIRIGNLTWDNLTITESKLSGPKTDGKIGYNFFADRISEFNFETGTLNLYSSLPDLNGYERLSIEFEHEMMFVVGSMQVGTEKLENRFLVHSGFGGSVLLDSAFVAENRLADRLETVSESELKDSYGNILKTRKVTLPKFSLGTSSLENVPVSIFEGKIGNQKMSVIGGDTLRRFHILIDLKNRNLYLKPNSFFNSEFAG